MADFAAFATYPDADWWFGQQMMLHFCNESFLHTNNISNRPWRLILSEEDAFNDVLVVVMEFYQMFVYYKNKIGYSWEYASFLVSITDTQYQYLVDVHKKVECVMQNNNYNLALLSDGRQK